MKKTLEEEKQRFQQILEHGATNMSMGFKPNQNDEEKTSQKYHDTLKDIANSGYDETTGHNEKFGMLPPELRNKDVYTKDELILILNALKKKVDVIGNYRIYDLERFLGIFVND
jgi:hypothetical protein